MTTVVDSSVQQFQTCIDACNKCMQACEECLTSCLKEADVQARTHCINILGIAQIFVQWHRNGCPVGACMPNSFACLSIFM